MPSEPSELANKLANIARYESTLRKTFLHRFLQAVGPTRWFAAIYRRIGPSIDRILLKRWGGRFATQVYGLPALLLITTGAKSGLPRTSPLLYVRDADAFVVVGTNFGTSQHPAWTANLLKNPAAQVVVGGETIDVSAQLADEQAVNRIWPKLVSMYGGYDAYLARLKNRTPRMFLLQPGRDFLALPEPTPN